MIEKLKISSRLVSLVVLSFIGILLLQILSLRNFHDVMTQNCVDKVRNISEIGRSIIEDYYKQYEAGTLTEDQAKNKALEALRPLRYSESEYYFIYDYDGTNILLPPKPEREGKNYIDLEDANGVLFIQELINGAKNNGQEVFYQFPKAGSDKPVDKVALAVSFEPWEWLIGTGIYLDDITKEFNNKMISFILFSLPIILVIVACALIITRSISVPLKNITHNMRLLATGDNSIKCSYLELDNEIGLLANALQKFKENAIETETLNSEKLLDQKKRESRHKEIENITASFDVSVSKSTSSVLSSSNQMQDASKNLLEIAEQTSSQATIVKSSSQEAFSSFQTVASATEELSSSIAEITRSIKAAKNIVDSANQETLQANEKMEGLVDTSNRVGDIVIMINQIAEQTNLLALNATIEAARAGEAGKGFAVVANEVKHLAAQTATATEDINSHIEEIQTSVTDATKVITLIVQKIQEMDEVTASVAASVEQQDAATREIAQNIEDVVSRMRTVADNIDEVNSAIEKTGDTSKEVHEETACITEKMQELIQIIQKFLEEVKNS